MTSALRWRDPQERLLLAREQILTGLLRAAALLGTLTWCVAILPPLRTAPDWVYLSDMLILAAAWLAAWRRGLPYWLRASVLLLVLHIAAFIDLLNYGFGQDAPLLFALFALLALLFLGGRAGANALMVSVTTLAVVGFAIGTGQFTPLVEASVPLSLSTAITTCLIFLMVVGSVQIGVIVLFNHLEAAWRHEHRAREQLEAQRDQLEQRVAERTYELAQARDQALAAQRDAAAQNEYLTALYQTTLELLDRREVGAVLQTIVERAATMLDAPYGELMLEEGGELVARAFTANQPFLQGDRVGRDQALLSWQAFDTRQPAILDDYSAWSGRRALYAALTLRAVIDFPILTGDHCIGVLTMGRAEPGRTFTPQDVERGVLFSHLAALVVENARLYDTALREIDERTKAEAALQRHAAELQGRNAELDAFAHTVAHDLKNPLTSLIGHAELLRTDYQQLSPAETLQSLLIVERAGRKMNAIINELLLLARVRSLDMIPLEALDMASILAEVEARTAADATQTHITLIKPESWPAALGYAPWIEEVWANYISNAIKYGGSPPVIELGAEHAEPGSIRFWVQDNGPGLSAEQQARLFTPFSRLHAERAQGHGLGLSIVQRIVDKLGGSVGVDSAPGRGARFFFTLPAPHTPPRACSEARDCAAP